MNRGGMNMVTEGADRDLRTVLAARHRGKRWVSRRAAVMNLNSPGPAGTVSFYSIGLSRIVLDRKWMSEDEATGQGKSGSAFLARKCGGPQVPPWLAAI